MPRDIQTTISGKDSGGFIFENVLNLTTDDMVSTVQEVLDAINLEVTTVILPAYAAAMTLANVLLDVSSRMSGITPSYSLHNPVSIVGARDLDSAVGALSGVLNFLPVSGVFIGRMFVAGCAVRDFVNDIIDPDYLGLLEDLAGALGTWDGTNATWHWQLKVLNKVANSTVSVTGVTARNRPTTLNKRMRA